jgi:hypothetical protein
MPPRVGTQAARPPSRKPVDGHRRADREQQLEPRLLTQRQRDDEQRDTHEEDAGLQQNHGLPPLHHLTPWYQHDLARPAFQVREFVPGHSHHAGSHRSYKVVSPGRPK